MFLGRERLKRAEKHMEAYHRACTLMKASARIEGNTAFVTFSNGDRIVMPLEKLMVRCRNYIRDILEWKIDADVADWVEAGSLKLLLDIPLYK